MPQISDSELKAMQQRLAELESGKHPMTWTATVNADGTPKGWTAQYTVNILRSDINRTLRREHLSAKGTITSQVSGTGGSRQVSNPAGVPDSVVLKIQCNMQATGSGTV